MKRIWCFLVGHDRREVVGRYADSAYCTRCDAINAIRFPDDPEWYPTWLNVPALVENPNSSLFPASTTEGL